MSAPLTKKQFQDAAINALKTQSRTKKEGRKAREDRFQEFAGIIYDQLSSIVDIETIRPFRTVSVGTPDAEDTNTIDLAIQIVDEDGAGASEEIDVLVTLIDAATGDRVAAADFTASIDPADANSTALVPAGGAGSSLVFTTHTNGISRIRFTDVAGASGVTLRAIFEIVNRDDGECATKPSISANITFD